MFFLQNQFLRELKELGSGQGMGISMLYNYLLDTLMATANHSFPTYSIGFTGMNSKPTSLGSKGSPIEMFRVFFDSGVLIHQVIKLFGASSDGWNTTFFLGGDKPKILSELYKRHVCQVAATVERIGSNDQPWRW